MLTQTQALSNCKAVKIDNKVFMNAGEFMVNTSNWSQGSISTCSHEQNNVVQLVNRTFKFTFTIFS